jgi:hypothetical protein
VKPVPLQLLLVQLWVVATPLLLVLLHLPCHQLH